MKTISVAVLIIVIVGGLIGGIGYVFGSLRNTNEDLEKPTMIDHESLKKESIKDDSVLKYLYRY